MVVKTIIRPLTSFVGAIIHTVAGLAVVLAIPVIVLFLAFAMPSLLGAVMNGFFDGTVTEVVTELSAETPLSTTRLGITLVGLIGIFVFGKRTGYIFYDIGKPTGDAPVAGQQGQSSASSESEPRDPAQQYLFKFQRSNLYLGGFLAFLLIAAVTAQTLVESGAGSNTAGNIILGLLMFMPQVFGGISLLGLNAALFLAVWYGLRQEATEALVGGIILWGLLGLSGLVSFTANAAGFGLIIAGLYGVYYGVKARDATDPMYFNDSILAEV